MVTTYRDATERQRCITGIEFFDPKVRKDMSLLDRLRPKQITLRKLTKVPIGKRDDPNSEHAA
jgi:hypothetical protein